MAAFEDLLAILTHDIRCHNVRGRFIPADIQLLTLRFYVEVIAVVTLRDRSQSGDWCTRT